MADDNQGQQQAPQAQPAAPQPQRGVPGTQQPPVPSAEKIAEIQRAQQQRLAQERAQAQEMAKNLAQHAPADVPIAQTNQPVTRIQANIPAAPPSPMSQAQAQALSAQQAAPSPVPGMSAAQVLAGPVQRQPQMQYAQQPNQFAKLNAQPEVVKPRVPWFPGRSHGNEIELTDVIITGIPENGIPAEGNAASKVVLALLSEVLALREMVGHLLAGGGGGSAEMEQRVGMLERVLHEQKLGMQSRARGVKEQIQMFTEQGMDAEAIVKALSEQSAAAERIVAEGGE